MNTTRLIVNELASDEIFSLHLLYAPVLWNFTMFTIFLSVRFLHYIHSARTKVHLRCPSDIYRYMNIQLIK